jgi:hypothetical protein
MKYRFGFAPKLNFISKANGMMDSDHEVAIRPKNNKNS